MKVPTKIKKLSRINPFSFDNKIPKKSKENNSKNKNNSLNTSKQNNNSKKRNMNLKNIKIFENYNSEFNKTITEFRKINSFKPEIMQIKPHNNYIIKFLDNELKSINSDQYINDVVKMFEIFQEELIYHLQGKYNNFNINKTMQNNFEIIIKYLINFFSIYKEKYKVCISYVKDEINNVIQRMKKNNSIINNYTNNNNNIIIFDENVKKYILNQEENIVNLINNLSSTIKIFNNKYKLLIINIENNLDSFNNKLIEIKNKINIINRNNTMTFNYNIKTNINYNEINKDIEKIYLTNINLNKEMKILDNDHKIFLEEAKEIFNNLRINHKIKIKKYQKLFDSLQNIKKNKKNELNNDKRGKSELKYLKINLAKVNNIRTRNLNNNLNTSMNKTSNLINKNNLEINLNNSQNSTNNNNSFNTTSTLPNKKMNNISFSKSEENNNIEIYYISQLMLEFFDKLKILQKAIINKEQNLNILKKEFEKYKKEIIKYLKNLMNKNKSINIIKYKKINEINISIISNNNKENIIQENKLLKDIINKFMEYIYEYLKETDNKNKEKLNKENINKYENEINNFFDKVTNDIKILKESNDKLNNELIQMSNKQKNIISKKSLIFDSGKDLNLSFRDKNLINDLNNKISSIEEEDTNKNNITGSFKKSENLNINEDIINLQINLQNRIKYLEKELEKERNKNLNYYKNNINIQNINFVKLYEEELSKNKILKEKYISEIDDINNNLIKYFQNLNEDKEGYLNYNYDYTNLNLSLTKAEIKELNNKIKEKDEKINELKQQIENQILIQKDKLYKPLRQNMEYLINEIKLNDKIKEILRELLNICLYTQEEIETIFENKEKNLNILGLYKI